MAAADSEFVLHCPVPADPGDRIVLAHGGGGKLSQRLFEHVFHPAFSNPLLDQRHDGAVLPAAAFQALADLAFSTDSYVVKPLVFPGGNIGDLAVHGTVNDLAMCGARPMYLSCAFILEEGLPVATLRAVVESMRRAAERAQVLLVTGDTKVVDYGKADGMFITTAGVGQVCHPVAASRIQPGDAIVVSGDLGAHGMAILSVREGLEFESPIVSDTAPLWPCVEALLKAHIDVHCLRDLTRGGLSSALNELAQTRGLIFQIEESLIPVTGPVRSACELFGLDPLYVANEGRFVAFLPAAEAQKAVDALKSLDVSQQATIIGFVSDEPGHSVHLRTATGGLRILQMLSGEQLPRIC
ncbi:MAG: hydrogenase expression/formation protein HypE [Bryobacteraceae bacterium]|nr:hydrogenase expression/formation protein HypE [Bryobacteraceae bacterium]MDW8380423.1 hydrogenase expression/formation protein HypE [Bryobacterales bacterium]